MRYILLSLVLLFATVLVSCGSQPTVPATATPTAQFAVLCDVPPDQMQTYVVIVPRPESGGYAGAAQSAVVKVWLKVWASATISDVWFYCEQLDNNKMKGSAGYLPVDPQDWRNKFLAASDGIGGAVNFSEWSGQTAARRISLSDTTPQVGPWMTLSLPDGWKVLP